MDEGDEDRVIIELESCALSAELKKDDLRVWRSRGCMYT